MKDNYIITTLSYFNTYKKFLSYGISRISFAFSWVITLLTLAVFLSSNNLNAQSGIYQSFVIIDSGSGNNYYDLNPQTQTGNFDFNGTNLGTFNSSSTLILNGGQNGVFKCGTDDITSGWLNYIIYPTGSRPASPVFIGINLDNSVITDIGFACSGAGDNQHWTTDNANINILNGLTTGNYTIEVYTNADFTYTGPGFGTHYANNGGALTNYTATFTLDDEAPTITCPTNITVNNTLGTCDAVVNYTVPVGTDNYSGAITTQTAGLVSGATFPVGTTTNTFLVTDVAGLTASCSFTVTVIDNQAPAISCPANISVNNTPGTCGTAVTYIAPVGTDNCSGATTTQTAGLASGSTFPVGITNNTFVVTDASGNTSTCSMTVTVVDNIVPTITCPSNITVNVGAGTCEAAVTVPAAVTADNCSVASVVNNFNGTANASGTYPLGTTTIVWTVTDGSGLTATCSQTVTVVDNIVPTITCPANITVNVGAGTCTAAVTVPAAVTADNCTVASVVNNFNGTANASGTYPLGTTTIVWTVTDASGNTSTCSMTVTVVDNINPTITCPANITVNVDAATCVAAVTVPAAVTADNCSVASVVNNFNNTANASGTYPLGTTAIVWTVTDGSGLTATCSQTVTVVDNIVPTITCPANITVNVGAGTCVAAVTVPAAVTADNCSVASVVNNFNGTANASGNYPLGTTTVLWTVTDASGNTSTCSMTVTVVDNINPTITCPANITVNVDAGTCVAAVTVPAAVTADNCSVASVVNNFNGTANASGNYPLGTSTIVWTVTDGSGLTATCSQTVTVADNINPTITCPSNITVNVGAGTCVAAVTVPAAVTADNCSVASVVNNFNGTANASGTYPLGTTTIVWTVTDGSGLTATCSQTVTVVDNIVPTITCPANITVNVGVGTCTAAVTVPAAVTADNCSVASVVNNFNGTANASGNYPLGTTTIVWTVTDGSGLTATCSQTVTVVDNIVPTITCPSNITVNVGAGTCVAAVTVPAAVTADNCSVASVVNNFNGTANASGTYPLGTTTIVWTVTDGSGLTATCSQTVTVVDNIVPTITCPSNITVNVGAGTCVAAVTVPAAVTADNCSVASVVNNFNGTANASGTYPLGTTTILWTVTDGSGLTATCSQTVTVVDNIVPTITCPAPQTLTLNASCAGVLADYRSLSTIADNCTATASLVVTQSPAIGSAVSGVGTTVVTLTVTDASGNSSNCSFNVNRVDTTLPTITCPANITVAANTACTATSVALGSPTTLDNCSVASVTNNAPVAFPLGSTTVTWTVTDSAGNIATCTQTVTVTDPTSVNINYAASPFCTSVASGSPTINVLIGGPLTSTGFSSTAGLIINSSTGVITPSSSAAGTYTVTYSFTGANGCSNSTTTSVTINPLPNAIAGVDRTIFRGDSTTLGAVAISGNTYSWVSNPTGFTSSISNPSVSPLVTTTYTLTETTPQGCVRSNSVIVTVKDNLVISKSLISAIPTKPGDNITYQISYSNLNNNGIAALNVTITDLLPPTTLFTYVSSSPAGTYNVGSNTLSWSIASLAAGSSGTITISGNVGALGAFGYDVASYYISSGSSTQTINNSASIVNSVTSEVVSNVVTNSVSQFCGVSIPATLNGEIHTSTNSNVFYFIQLVNTGNITDRFSLVNNNPVQTGVPLTSVITDMAGNTITQTPWLTPGQTYNFLVQFTTPGGTPGSGTNRTFIRATSTVCNTFETTDITTVIYNGAQANGCDLLISKTASAGSVIAGANIIYTITVRNLSNNKANDVVINDTLPTSVNYVSHASITGGTTVTWNPTTRVIRAVRNGNYNFSDPDIVITITVQTTCSTVPSVTNTATVDNKNADNNLLNNSSSITVTVLPNVSDPIPTSMVICTGNSATITMPSPGVDRNYKWYSAATGGTLLQTNGNTYNTGVLTSSTTYYVSQYNTLSPTCESNRTPILVTVVSAPVIIAQPVSHTNCSSAAIFTYNVTGTFLSQQWQESTDGGLNWNNLANIGVYSGVTTQILTISNVTGLNGNQYKCILNSSTCYTLTSDVVSIVALPTAPVIGTITQPTCAVPSGSVTLNGLPASGTWTINPGGITGTGTSRTISGLIAGTYSYTVTNSVGCTSSSSSSFTIKPSDNIWSIAGWSTGLPPTTGTERIIFNYPYTSTLDLNGCSCIVNGTNAVTISSGNTMTLTNELTVSATASLTFENNASLVQINNVANIGNIIYKRIAQQRRSDYVYWSSPVDNFDISSHPSNGPKYSWNALLSNPNGFQGNWQIASGIMIAGQGYIVSGPSSFNNTVNQNLEVPFFGVPRNGNITIPIYRGINTTPITILPPPSGVVTNLDDNWNLLGNPYPSAISCRDFLTLNNSVLNGALYIWTHGSLPSSSLGNPFYDNFGANYNPIDYVPYNLTGNLLTPNPDYFIGAGQGFFVTMFDGPTGSANVNFNNSLRSTNYGNVTGTNFFRSSAITETENLEFNRIWLDLIKNNNSVRTLVGYVSGATMEKDNLHDAISKYDNSSKIFSLINEDRFVIQGRSLPFNDLDKVKIGIDINENGEYSIGLAMLDGLFLNETQNIFLEDKVLNVIHNLRHAPYFFNSTIGTFTERFVLRYTDNSLGNPTQQIDTTFGFINDHVLKVQSTVNIKQITIYDITGKEIKTYKVEGSSNHFEDNFPYANGVYIAKITLENDVVVKKKLIH